MRTAMGCREDFDWKVERRVRVSGRKGEEEGG